MFLDRLQPDHAELNGRLLFIKTGLQLLLRRGQRVNVPGPVATEESRSWRPVFVSYATPDRKQALGICHAIERRGPKCWISTRDVAPGENYQEAIVHAIRNARAMVLVFSEAANNSDEIKKELSLASRYHVPVMALRIEDVEPTDAFAYELSTRQWIDAFAGWDKSIDSLVVKVGQLGGATTAAPPISPRPRRERVPRDIIRQKLVISAGTAAVLALSASAWLILRPSPVAAHTMLVRLSGFQRLSPDLPATLPQALNDEIVSAFATDGVVEVSTASAPPAGTAPAYGLGGTVRAEADKIKFIAKITNERSGLTLWSNTYTFNTSDLARMPRWAAVQMSQVARCGLFAASTYPKPIADETLSKYFEMCTTDSPTRSLDIANQIVAATPDFSWGWSAVEVSALAAMPDQPGPQREQFRKIGLRAANEAIRLDHSNSEAYGTANYLIDASDVTRREQLVKQAIASRPLACGCEHHFYGNLLMEVGRVHDATVEYARAVDVLPLNPSSQMSLGEALIADGKPEQSKDHFDAVVDMADDPSARDQITIETSPLTGNYGGVVEAFANPKFRIPPSTRDAEVKGIAALKSRKAGDRTSAIAALSALPPTRGGRFVTLLLGALGANAQALRRIDARQYDAGLRTWLWYPSMAGAIRDPSFPALAERLGLMHYWKTTHTRPDVCSTNAPPSFCKML